MSKCIVELCGCCKHISCTETWCREMEVSVDYDQKACDHFENDPEKYNND